VKPDAGDDGAPSEAEPTPQTNGESNGAGDEVKPPSKEQDFMNFELNEDHPLYTQFKEVMDRFGDPDKENPASKEADKGEVFFDDDEDIPDEDQEKEMRMSKKKRKEQSKLSVAELKALVRKPELVDWTDVSASDPRLLVSIKSHRNVVPVPTHWSLKREYLSSKRGIEKPPFALPKFIQETGIAEMRDAVLEKQNDQTLKQRQRERVNPKMGKLDIDYQRLYEAFFRFQTKPELTRFGEVYYEGKEFETDLKHLRPGELSEELKEALNIPPGAPPPWLINMQRFGPPPSYPNLKIPGLNAPPPPGGQWGYHPGGYGKPPVDEYNRPLYGGDIFGVLQPQQTQHQGEAVEKTLWGELEEPEEESEEEEDSDEEEDADEDEEDIGGLQTPSGMETPGGMASTVPSEYGGSESVSGEFTLRKERYGTETEEPREPRSAYQVLPEQNIRSQGFFGGDRAYDLSGGRNQQNIPQLDEVDNRRKRKAGDVDVSVDVDSLEKEDRLSRDEVRRQYDAQRQAEQQQRGWGNQADREDLDDMIATESRKRLKKDEERRSRR
jgi:splicing factor 3B subunit 2